MNKYHQLWIIFFALVLSTYAVAEMHLMELPDVDEVYPLTIDWRGKTVLHIGDSHVSRGLTSSLRKNIQQAKGIYRSKVWVGSRSKSWMASGRFRRLLERHAPQIVIVTLGTNAMGNQHPERHTSWIKAIASKIGKRKCFWMGPPPLIEDKYGFNETLQKACAPCKYFDTRQLNFPMRHDKKFHLTHKQSEYWAEQTWRWMNNLSVVAPQKEPGS